jgi:hypoxanthine phosphoribosyltransferase
MTRSVGDAAAEAVAVLRASRRLFTAREVRSALACVAREAAEVLAGTNPVVLVAMQGGAYAALEISRRWRFAHELDYVHATRYGGATRGRELEWRVRPSPMLAGRTVLVVDDVLDHGVTLAAVQAELARIGVARQYSAVLVVKELDEPMQRPHVDFTGLTVGDEYVFGCGMDYKGYWRTLPALHAVAQEEIE